MPIISQITLNGILTGCIYCLIALSFGLSYKTVKLYNLAHVGLILIGGYSMILFYKMWSFPFVPALVLSIFTTATITYLIQTYIYTPLRNRGATDMAMLVASLGVNAIIGGLIAIIFTNRFQSIADTSAPTIIYNFLNLSITQIQLFNIITTILVIIFVFSIIKYSHFGRAILAIGDSEEIAKIFGINTKKIIGQTAFLSGAIAGLAGIIIGFDTGLQPTYGMMIVYKGIAANIIGGMGNLPLAALTSIILGIIENLSVYFLNGQWRDLIAFLLMIIFMYLRSSKTFAKK